jgi:hypothetical protein
MLDNDADTQRLESHLRTMRVMIGAMIVGIASFLGIVVFLVQLRAANLNQQIMLSSLAVAFFGIMFVAWWFLPDVVVKSQVQQIANGTWTQGKNLNTSKEIPATTYPTDASKLLAVNQTRSIIAAALLEGAAFFGCVAYMVEGQVFTLAVPGVVLALMALTFPTRDRVGQWVDEQQMRINDSRSERG